MNGSDWAAAGADINLCSLRTYDSQGNTLLVIKPHNNDAQGVAVDPVDGSLYLASWGLGGYQIGRYSRTGVQDTSWQMVHGDATNCVAVDPIDRSVVIGGWRRSYSDFLTTRKFSYAGTLLWSVDHGAEVHSVAISPIDRSIVTGGEPDGSGLAVRKYDKDGNLLWSKHGPFFNDQYYGVNKVVIDPNDNSIVVTDSPWKKYSAEGEFICEGPSVFFGNYFPGGTSVGIYPKDGSVYGCSSDWVSKADRNGVLIWEAQLWSTFWGVTCMGVDPLDGSVIYGYPQYSYTNFRKIDANGTHQWYKIWGENPPEDSAHRPHDIIFLPTVKTEYTLPVVEYATPIYLLNRPTNTRVEEEQSTTSTVAWDWEPET
jgi:hypothetical protein